MKPPLRLWPTPAPGWFTVGVMRLFGDGESLTGIEVLDASTGETIQLPAQTLFFSAGRFPELVFTRPAGEDQSETTAWIAVPPYKQPAHADEAGVFAKGDALTDFSGAIKAIGAGRRAAATIHKLIYDIPLDLPDNVLKPDTAIQNVDRVDAGDDPPAADHASVGQSGPIPVDGTGKRVRYEGGTGRSGPVP